MVNSIVQFKKFLIAFNKNEGKNNASLNDIEFLENMLKIKLPEDFKFFMINYGNLWTPLIVDVIVDKEIDMNDIQQFWTTNEIIEDKRNGYTNQIKEDLVAFASDCMGNIYVFKTKESKHNTLLQISIFST